MATSFQDSKLQTILEKIAKDEGFEKPTFNIASATNPGENFIGQVFRVKIEGPQKKCLSLIFKVSSPSKERNELLQSDALFRTESLMYGTIFPTLNELLKKHGLCNSPIFPGTPRCYLAALSASPGESDVIVLEDKKVDGFVLGSVKAGLDEGQCREALRRIALLHSSYLALRELDPHSAENIRDRLNRPLWNGADDPMIVDFRQGYLNGLELAGEPYIKGNSAYEKLYKLYENFSDDFLDLCKMPEKIGCINHCDFWVNNVLFKQGQDGTTEDACLIDFQISAMQSPINDLAGFFFMCTTKELRDKCFEDLIKFYYDEVKKTLRGCGCDPEKVIPWTTFSEQLKFYGKTGIIMALGSLPVLLADKAEDVHSTDTAPALFTETAKITNPETKKQVTKRLNGVICDAERWGMI